MLFISQQILTECLYAWTTSANKTDNDLFSWSLYFKCEDQKINMKLNVEEKIAHQVGMFIFGKIAE